MLKLFFGVKEKMSLKELGLIRCLESSERWEEEEEEERSKREF